MCKVFMVTNMAKMENINTAINVIAQAVSTHDDDGFGYVMQGEKGLFGERTLDTEKFKTQFRRPIQTDAFIGAPYYNRFGTKGKAKGAGLFHGRTSTNNVSLINTHPISKHGWHLIHNGVVSNHGPGYEQLTSNDTEHILHWLANEGIGAVEKYITGYYAVGAIDPHGYVHIFKDSTASLYCAALPELDAHVFATTYDLIEEVCAELKWKTSVINKVNDDTYLVFNHGKLLSHTKIKPRGRTQWEDQYAERSLGYSLNNTTRYSEYDDYQYGDKYNSGYKSYTPPSGYVQGGEPTSNVTDIRTIGANIAEVLAESKEVVPIEVNGNTAVSPEHAKFVEHVRKQVSSEPSEHSLFSYSEEQFLKECKEMADHSYLFKDYYGEEMEYEQFLCLADNEMLYCTVVRPDGTLVDQLNYESETLYDGQITRARA